jgi:hypothetical protein
MSSKANAEATSASSCSFLSLVSAAQDCARAAGTKPSSVRSKMMMILNGVVRACYIKALPLAQGR